MGVALRHTKRDPRTGIVSYRRGIPEALRPFWPDGPRREFKRGLGRSATLAAPAALQAYEAAQAEFARLADLARKAATAAFDPLDPPMIIYLVETYRHRRLQNDEWDRLSGRQRNNPARLERLEANDLGLSGLAAEATGDQLQQLYGEEAVFLAASEGLRVDPGSRDFAALCFKLCEADADVASALLARAQAIRVPTPTAPPRPPRPAESPSEAPAAPTLAKIIEALLDRPSAPVSRPTREIWSTASRHFAEIVGDIPLATVTRLHVSGWRDALVRKPARLPASQKSLPLPDLVRLYPPENPIPRLGLKTRNTHQSALKAIWNRASNGGLLPEDIRNPFAAGSFQPLPGERQPTTPSGFTVAQLNSMFRLPVFAQGERPTNGRGEAAYWFPLIQLWTGARTEEVAQLLVSDFRIDPRTDCLTITFTEEGEHPVKGRRTLKTEKRMTGRRTFPVPQELIRIGLREYIKHLEAAGETALFPRLQFVRSRGLSVKFAEWWGSYLREHGVLSPRTGKPTYDFRHAFTTAARASGLSESASPSYS